MLRRSFGLIRHRGKGEMRNGRRWPVFYVLRFPHSFIYLLVCAHEVFKSCDGHGVGSQPAHPFSIRRRLSIQEVYQVVQPPIKVHEELGQVKTTQWMGGKVHEDKSAFLDVILYWKERKGAVCRGGYCAAKAITASCDRLFLNALGSDAH